MVLGELCRAHLDDRRAARAQLPRAARRRTGLADRPGRRAGLAVERALRARSRPAEVLQLLDRHNRDSLARRWFGLPHLKVPAAVPDTPSRSSRSSACRCGARSRCRGRSPGRSWAAEAAAPHRPTRRPQRIGAGYEPQSGSVAARRLGAYGPEHLLVGPRTRRSRPACPGRPCTESAGPGRRDLRGASVAVPRALRKTPAVELSSSGV